MLEERWRQVVSERADDWALLEPAAGRSWTFRQLAAAADAEGAPRTGPSGLVCPSGNGPEFILAVLRAWRAGAVVCPLEPGQSIPSVAPPPTAIVHLKLTSGTTGIARAVAFTAAQLAADVDQLVPTMGLHPGWPNLGVISLAHSYGFSNLVTPLLLHGIPLILAPSALPAAVHNAAAAVNSPLTLPAVPALWRVWHDAEAIPPNVRLALSAGAPLPIHLEQAVFDRSGLKLHNFLGASECGGIAYDPTPVPRSDPAWIGSPITGVQLTNTDDGRLVVSASSVGEGYWPLASEGRERLGGGRYIGADLIELAPDGGIWLRGRTSEFINVAGRKVAPDLIEAALLSHGDIVDCLAFAIPDLEGRGECVGAVVVPRRELSAGELRDFLLTHLPAWQIPRRWWWRQQLETDARGKRSRREWRERLLTTPDESVHPVPNGSKTLN